MRHRTSRKEGEREWKRALSIADLPIEGIAVKIENQRNIWCRSSEVFLEVFFVVGKRSISDQWRTKMPANRRNTSELKVSIRGSLTRCQVEPRVPHPSRSARRDRDRTFPDGLNYPECWLIRTRQINRGKACSILLIFMKTRCRIAVGKRKFTAGMLRESSTYTLSKTNPIFTINGLDRSKMGVWNPKTPNVSSPWSAFWKKFFLRFFLLVHAQWIWKKEEEFINFYDNYNMKSIDCTKTKRRRPTIGWQITMKALERNHRQKTLFEQALILR